MDHDESISAATSRRQVLKAAATVAAVGGVAGIARPLAAEATPTSNNTWKDAVRVATVANGILASSFANGSTVDGVVLATGDRILVKNQTTAIENGIYVVAASGAPTRATDYALASDVANTFVPVNAGDLNRKAIFTCANAGVASVGAANLVFYGVPRPLALLVRASNCKAIDIGAGAVDFQCTGTNDDQVISSALTLANFLGPGAVVELSSGDFDVATPIYLAGNDLTLRGQARGGTRLNRSSATSELIYVQGSSGAANHVARITLQDLRLDGGAGTGAVLRLENAGLVDVDRVYIRNGVGYGVLTTELWDSEFRDCRFDSCGSSGASGALVRASVSVRSGTLDSDNVHFTNCTWESYKDRALEFVGSGSNNRVNKCHVINCKLESQIGITGTSVVLDFCTYITFRNFNTTSGKNVPGVITAQDVFKVTNTPGLIIDGYYGESNLGVQNVRTLLSLQGGNAACSLDNLFFAVQSTNYPALGCVEFSGTNTEIDLKTFAFEYDGTVGTAILLSGDSTRTKRFENRGSSSIAAAATSVNVTHNLRKTPDVGDIVVTAGPTGAPSDIGFLWVSATSSTTFTVKCRVAPAAVFAFGWSASARRS